MKQKKTIIDQNSIDVSRLNFNTNGCRCYSRLIPVFITTWRNRMDKERESSALAWLLSPGEEAILATNVQVSLKPSTSLGVSRKACLIQEKEKM